MDLSGLCLDVDFVLQTVALGLRPGVENADELIQLHVDRVHRGVLPFFRHHPVPSEPCALSLGKGSHFPMVKAARLPSRWLPLHH